MTRPASGRPPVTLKRVLPALRRLLALLSFLLALVLAASPGRADEQLSSAELRRQIQDGDLLFQESRSPQSAAIHAVTQSRYSHVGLVFGAGTSAPYVLEAVEPVRRTPLDAFLRRGEQHHFVLMRVRDTAALTPARRVRIQQEAARFLTRHYDARFQWSDARLYCSELVWKAYERGAGLRLSEPERWRDLDISSDVAQALALKRLGKLPDPEALIITPARIMQSKLLRTVHTGQLAAP
jgi:hypothetical protein